MEGQMTNLRNQNESSRRSYSTLETENRKLKRESGEMKHVMSTLEAAVRDMQPRIQETEKVCEEQKEKLELQEKQLEGFEGQKKLLSDRNVVLIKKCETLQADMDKMKEDRQGDLDRVEEVESRFQSQGRELDRIGNQLVGKTQDLDFARIKLKDAEKAMEQAVHEKSVCMRDTMKAKGIICKLRQRSDTMAREYKAKMARFDQLFQTVNARVASMLSDEEYLELQEQLQAEFQMEILKQEEEEGEGEGTSEEQINPEPQPQPTEKQEDTSTEEEATLTS